jgi:sulfate permease, SulP family
MKWKNLFTRKTIFADTIAGIVVALILIPQSIAYAQLAGLPPQQGLYAAFIAPIVFAFFNPKSLIATGPVAIGSLITASALNALHIQDPYIMVQYAAILAIMVGLIQLAFGVFKIGGIVHFISYPVMLGFSNAAALVIATSQLPKMFGISLGNYTHNYETMYYFLLALPNSTHLLSLCIALIAIILISLLKKVHPLTPAVLIVMILSILFSSTIRYHELGGSIVGEIPRGLPTLNLPQIEISTIPTLFSTALIVAILGFMESFSIAKSLALKTKQKMDLNRQFIGQGLANIASAAFQGYSVSGSFSRSAVNYKAGAATAMSSIISGLCVLLAILFFTPLLYHLPQSVLSAIIIASVLNLLTLSKIKETYQLIPSEGIIAIITFVATLFFAPRLDQGILIGVLLSTAYYIYTRTRPHVIQFTANRNGKLIEFTSKQKVCEHIKIIRFDGSLIFANAAYLENNLRQIILNHHDTIQYVILDAQGINFIDVSGIETLQNLYDELKEIEIQIVFVRLKEEILQVFHHTQLHNEIKHHQYESRTAAIRAIYHRAHQISTEAKCPLSQI